MSLVYACNRAHGTTVMGSRRQIFLHQTHQEQRRRATAPQNFACQILHNASAKRRQGPAEVASGTNRVCFACVLDHSRGTLQVSVSLS